MQKDNLNKATPKNSVRGKSQGMHWPRGLGFMTFLLLQGRASTGQGLAVHLAGLWLFGGAHCVVMRRNIVTHSGFSFMGGHGGEGEEKTCSSPPCPPHSPCWAPTSEDSALRMLGDSELSTRRAADWLGSWEILNHRGWNVLFTSSSRAKGERGFVLHPSPQGEYFPRSLISLLNWVCLC